MIPFVAQPSLSVGPLTIYAFGAVVAASLILGLEIGRRRFRRLGVQPDASERFAWHVVVGGFAGAHLFSLLFYFPERLHNDPLAVVRFWENLSSFGGIVGGLSGMAVYFRRVRGTLSPRERWIYFDVVAFVFAISLMVGRVACTLAHDHPGTVTDFPLAISLETDAARAHITDVYAAAGRGAQLPPAPILTTLAFHDLGWYEFVYLALVVSLCSW